MRRAWLLVLLLIPALAQGAGLPGTYVVQSGGTWLVAHIEVKEGQLSGIVDVNGTPTVTLSGPADGNVSHGVATSSGGSGTYEAVVDGDELTVTLSQEAGPQQQAATVPFVFRRSDSDANPAPAPPAEGAGDARLVGNWTHQELLGGDGASMAIEETLAIRADGTFAYRKGRSVAGGAGWSFDGGSGGNVTRGRWRSANGVLFVLGANGQWARVGTYGMTSDGRTLRIIFNGGGRKLWSRQ